ncbi:unnamed protein product, partial [marine sediment metagenome]
QRILETYRQALDALEAERESLAALQSTLRQLSEQDLQLHRSNAAALAAMRKEVDRMRRQLKRLATAGA